jgi:protein subunit release factor B
MNFPHGAPVTPAKLNLLRSKIAALNIRLADIEEKFIRGGGKGGQKINKTSNTVVLYYPLYDIRIRVQRERQRELNRFLALRDLVDRVEKRLRA